MSVAPAVLPDGTVLPPLTLYDGATAVWQVKADGRMGIGDVDISNAGATLRLKGPATTGLVLDNPSTTVLAQVTIQAASDTAQALITALSPASASNTTLITLPLAGSIRTGPGATGGLILCAGAPASPIIFATGGAALTDQKWLLTAAGHLVALSASYGLVLLSANGHYWELTVSNAGAAVWTDLGTNLPA